MEYIDIQQTYSIVIDDLIKINKDEPKILDVLNHIKEIKPVAIVDWYNIDLFLDKRDNSYNSNSDFVFEYGIKDELLYISFHYNGDVRGNYSDYFVFELDDLDLNDLFIFSDDD